MNFDHYRNFMAVADCGTISAAAEKLHIAQPALSNQIKNLEEEYGAQLIIRGSRHVELTDAGRILYARAQTISELEDAARKEIGACVSGSAGTLRLAFTPSYPDPLLTALLMDFHREYPGVSYELFERNTGEIIEALKSGVSELGIIRTPARAPAYLRTLLKYGEHMMVLYRRDNPRFSPGAGEISVDALRGVPISIPRGFRDSFTELCLSRDFTPEYLCVSSSRSAAGMWADDGRTAAILVGSRAYDDGQLCCRPLAGEGTDTFRTLAALKGARLSSVSESFVDFCKNYPALEKWNR
jgi:DNA-binding transcriptional LysR family regulator